MTLRSRDGLVLSIIKAVARQVYVPQVRWRRWRAKMMGQSQWVLGGDCKKCAVCCERPAIQVDWFIWHIRSARAFFLWWQRRINGWVLTGTERKRSFVFRCEYFDTTTRRCTSYESRPFICRDYPRLLLEQGWPEFLPGCGYRSIAANAEKALVVLNTSQITPEQREQLKKKLRLE